MSKNQATAYQHQELYESIKKIDINALRAFVLCTTADIVAQIAYWDNRKKNPGLDEDQISVINLEIIRLEAIMIARTRITMDLFEVVELTDKDSDVMSRDLHKTLKVEPGKTKEEVNLPINDTKPADSVKEEKQDAKIIQMNAIVPIKLSEIFDNVKVLLAEGKMKEAEELAKKYLTPGLYLPNKEHQKPEQWHEGRIKSWISEAMKHVKKPVGVVKNDQGTLEKKDESSSKEKANVSTNQTSNVPEQKDNTSKSLSDNSSEIATIATTQSDGIEDAKEVKWVDFRLEEWPKIERWILDSGKTVEQFLEEVGSPDLLTPESLATYTVFDVEIEDAVNVIKMLKEKYDINASLAAEEIANSEVAEDPWENQTYSLQEENDLIEGFLEKAAAIRGNNDHVSDKDKIKQLNDLSEEFFLSRDDADYPGWKKVGATLASRPKLLLEAKELYSFCAPIPLGLYTMKIDGKDVSDCFAEVKSQIKNEIFEISSTEDAEVRETIYDAFEVKWIKELRGKILNGKENKDDKQTHQKTFYTQYHVIHFIEQIENEIISGKEVEAAKPKGENHIHPANAAGKSAATATEAVATASTEKETAPNAKPKVHICTSLEEALLMVAKNAGVAEDAMEHPFCIALKGKKIKDPNSTAEIELNDENYKKYITDEFEKVVETWKNQQTHYPLEEMAKLISLSHSTAVTPEEFVKENIGLIKRSDGSFLNLTGKMGDVEQTTLIKSEKDFQVWVAEMYALEEELNNEDNNPTTFEMCSYRGMKEFQDAVMKKVIDDKLSFEDLQKWAREEVIDKVFTSDPSGQPVFTHEKAGNLDQFLEIITRKAYETPESRAAKEKEIEDAIIKGLPDAKVGLLGFVGEIKALCISKKFDIDLKAVREKVLKFAEIHNKVMYDKYMKIYSELKEENLIADAKDTNAAPVKSEDNKKVIVDASDKNGVTAKVIENILNQCKEVTTKEGLEKVLNKFKSNPTAMLKAAIVLICDKKQIKDITLDEAGVNAWVVELFSDKSKETNPTQAATEKPEKTPGVKEEIAADATSIKKESEIAPVQTETISELETLKMASDKKNFREALDAIARKFDDSSEMRTKIINAMRQGTGAHTRKVGKGPVQDMQMSIKNAYERIKVADKVVDVE